jgi:hypothetical protein
MFTPRSSFLRWRYGRPSGLPSPSSYIENRHFLMYSTLTGSLEIINKGNTVNFKQTNKKDFYL